MELIKETTIWEREDERILVQACHDGLRALFAKEAKAARSRKGSRSLRDRWDDMKEDLRRNLMHAKTRQMLRGVLSEFFARADYAGKQGDPPPALKQHLPSVWRLLDDPRDWRKARDLSLLALASYVPKPAATGTEVDSAPDGEGDMDSQEHEEIES